MYIHIYKDINDISWAYHISWEYLMGISTPIYIFNEIIGCKENMMAYTMIRLIFTL